MARKRKIYAMPWMDLENVTLSEISENRKATHCMILLYEVSRKGKSIEKTDW